MPIVHGPRETFEAPILTEIEANTIASELVWVLTGRSWTSPPKTVIERYPINPERRIRLVRVPVASVTRITVSGIPVTGHEVESGNNILLPRTVETCRPGAKVVVEYVYGSTNPPALAVRAIKVLAYELLIASGAKGNAIESRIPERVTSISRQGVSWTMIDPQDFLDQGRTGIYEVDLCIKALKPKSGGRSMVFSPEYPPPEVLSTFP